jgi:hypothetical protein
MGLSPQHLTSKKVKLPAAVEGVTRPGPNANAVGETKRPGNLRGDVIADGARQDITQVAERCSGEASLWSGGYPSRESTVRQLFTLSRDQFRGRFTFLCHRNIRRTLAPAANVLDCWLVVAA